jgi:hypothetical protein
MNIHIGPGLNEIQKTVQELTQQLDKRDVGFRNIFDSSWDKDKQWCREVERIQMVFSQLETRGMNPKDLKLHEDLKSKIKDFTDAAESMKIECVNFSKHEPSAINTL